MVNSVECAGFFQGHQVARLFDDADGGLVASRVAADGADGLVGFGQVEADLAMADLLFGVADGVGQLEGFFVGAADEVVGQPFGRLDADSGQGVPRRRPDDRRPPRSRAQPWSASLVARSRRAEIGKEAGGQPAGHGCERLGRGFAGLGKPGVDRRHDQVFEQLGVAIGDQLGVDMHRHDLEPAVDLDRHRTAAGVSFHFELAQRLNRLAQLAGVLDQFREHSQLIEHGFLFPAGCSSSEQPRLNRSSKDQSMGRGSVSRPSVFRRRVVLAVIHLDGPRLEELEHALNHRVF